MISVIIPLYNKAKSIAGVLDCVLSQTYQDFEVVVVDDGSTDDGAAIVDGYTDARIRLIRQVNAGVSAARNRGIAEARGEYVAFLDADDEWTDDYLSIQYDLSTKFPDCDVFATNYRMKYSNGDITPAQISKIRFVGDDGVLANYFEVASCSHPPLWTSAVMVRKSSMECIGGFPVGIKSGEDLLTWARLAIRYKVAYTRNVAATFVVDDNHKVSQKPTRAHDDEDFVGVELVKLIDCSFPKDRKWVKKYVSLWYKMRVSVCLRMDEVSKTWEYGFKALRYNLCNYKVYLMMGMVLLPSVIQNSIKKKYANG